MTRYALDTQNNLIKGIPYSDQKLPTNVQFQSFVFNIPPPPKKRAKILSLNGPTFQISKLTGGRMDG